MSISAGAATSARYSYIRIIAIEKIVKHKIEWTFYPIVSLLCHWDSRLYYVSNIFIYVMCATQPKDKLIKADTHIQYKYLYVIRFLWSSWECCGSMWKWKMSARISAVIHHCIRYVCVDVAFLLEYAECIKSVNAMEFFSWYHFRMECQCRYVLTS